MTDEAGIICAAKKGGDCRYLLQRLHDRSFGEATSRYRVCSFLTGEVEPAAKLAFFRELEGRQRAFAGELGGRGERPVPEFIRERSAHLEARNAEEMLDFFKRQAAEMVEGNFGADVREMLDPYLSDPFLYLPRPVNDEAGDYTTHLLVLLMPDEVFQKAHAALGKAIDPEEVRSEEIDQIVLWEHVVGEGAEAPEGSIVMSHADRVVLRHIDQFVQKQSA